MRSTADVKIINRWICDTEWSHMFIHEIIDADDLDTLERLRIAGYPQNDLIGLYAGYYGRERIVKWVRDVGFDDGLVVTGLALGNHPELLREYGNVPSTVIWQSVGPPRHMAMHGNFEMLKWLKSVGYPVFGVIWRAMVGNSVECMEWAVNENGESFITADTLEAARAGSLECLKVAHEKYGAELHENTWLEAALNGHLDCLQYAHEHGSPVDLPTVGIMKECPARDLATRLAMEHDDDDDERSEIKRSELDSEAS